MSILITGMDLPTEGCIELQVFAEGKAIQSGYTVRVNGMDYYQPTLGEKPAVAAIGLPAEHGRLIDADALKVSLAFSEKTAEWAVPALRAVLMVIDEMPTIEAEKKK